MPEPVLPATPAASLRQAPAAVESERTAGEDTRPLVSADGVGRTYQQGQDSIPALIAVTCRVYAGDHIALMGPTGSGNSTLLHLMGGLDAPTSGTLTWPALDPRLNLRPVQVAVVFQTPSLLSALNVIENVELPLLLGGVSPTDARAAALRALAGLELAALAEQLPEEISGGQAQRVALARAIAYRPRLILADEPTGQLDQHTAERLLDVLLAALVGSGTALVVATHDAAVARRMDRIWLMEHGRLEARS